MKKILRNKKVKLIIIMFVLLIPMILLTLANMTGGSLISVLNPNDEAANFIKQIFQNRKNAIISKNYELLRNLYDMDTKYGVWAYEYELRKTKYIQKWERRQGIIFTVINPEIVIRSLKCSDSKLSANLICSTEYKYIYEDRPDEINRFRIGTYHALTLVKKEDAWVIAKEWYKDPFGDSMNLSDLAIDTTKQFILSQGPRDLSNISKRRIKAAEYAEQYCGAASDPKYGFKYNKKYRNYNSLGGDCANFASQILFEGGKFRKTHAWNYDRKGATRAWVNADGFKSYMIYSGRASLIAYGSYGKVYKASYKLLPGDFVAYEKKGDITHISVVTGADSRGYTLVSCHNTDRNNVPWDLGWSDAGIRFWLVRMHY